MCFSVEYVAIFGKRKTFFPGSGSIFSSQLMKMMLRIQMTMNVLLKGYISCAIVILRIAMVNEMAGNAVPVKNSLL
jgi:hypothetical protein